MAVAVEVSFFLTILAIVRLFLSVNFGGRPLRGLSLNEWVCLTVLLMYWMALTDRPVAALISLFVMPCSFKTTTWARFSCCVISIFLILHVLNTFSETPAKVFAPPLTAIFDRTGHARVMEV